MKTSRAINTLLLLSTLFACSPEKKIETNVVLNNVSGDMNSYNVVNLKMHILSLDLKIKNKLDDFESRLTIGKNRVAYTNHIVSDTSKLDSTTYRLGYTSEELDRNAIIEFGSVLKCNFDDYGEIEKDIIDIDLHEGAHIHYRTYKKEPYNAIRTEMFSLLVEMTAGDSPKKVFNVIDKYSTSYLYTRIHPLASKMIMSEFDKQKKQYPLWDLYIPEISRNILKKEFGIPLEDNIVHETGFQPEKFFEKHYLK